jgi:hypothetical protein
MSTSSETTRECTQTNESVPLTATQSTKPARSSTKPAKPTKTEREHIKSLQENGCCVTVDEHGQTTHKPHDGYCNLTHFNKRLHKLNYGSKESTQESTKKSSLKRMTNFVQSNWKQTSFMSVCATVGILLHAKRHMDSNTSSDNLVHKMIVATAKSVIPGSLYGWGWGLLLPITGPLTIYEGVKYIMNRPK